MAISIKSIGGSFNEVPIITNLKATKITNTYVEISYNVDDVEESILRHYITVKTTGKVIMNHVEITKQIGYENKNASYRIEGLSLGTDYTIQIFASDGNDETASEALHVQTANAFIYGVRVMENNSNPETSVTYIEESVGITPASNTSLNGWANKWPFNKVRNVSFKAGKVIKEVNKNNRKKYIDGTTVPATVDIFTEIPKVFWKFTQIDGGYEIRISNIDVDGTYRCYAHTVNGKEKDHIYVGTYLGSFGALSRSGQYPSTNSFNTCKHSCRESGAGYQMMPFYTWSLLQILFIIAFKHRDADVVLGRGATMGGNGAKQAQNGLTDEKGFIYGSKNMSYGLTDGVTFIGIENLWGNYYQCIDGFYSDSNGNIYVSQKNADFDNKSNYVKVGQQTTANRDGYITKVRATTESCFLPLTIGGGSSSTYYCDKGACYKNSNYAKVGGYYYSPYEDGIFNFQSVTDDPDGNYTSQGFRICYLGV